jgi:hypothetical protein
MADLFAYTARTGDDLIQIFYVAADDANHAAKIASNHAKEQGLKWQ